MGQLEANGKKVSHEGDGNIVVINNCGFINNAKEWKYFVGRTEFDSPDVDNEVLIDASKVYLKIGEFSNVIITDASDFDLYAKVK